MYHQTDPESVAIYHLKTATSYLTSAFFKLKSLPLQKYSFTANIENI